MATLTESPVPVRRFKQHVGFDNLPNGEATKHNTSSLSLQVRHQGYRPSRMSRTFMVGVDDHAYSDYALVWLLHNMVDDGDEVVCVRVLESPVRTSEKSYQEDAWRLMRSIQAKNELNKAISLILEYSVGKLHATFQQLQIQIYQPSMLIVGTRGRSLGGIQGLMNTRNSFSKYCLQYSPVPVVVVRPDDKRNKKKEKRMLDPTRQSYVAMLAHNAGKHEAESGASSLYELERGLSADEEAHRVAAAIGLPAAFDPTIKAFDHRGSSAPRQSPSAPPSPPLAEMTSASSPRTVPSTESGDEESEEEEYEVEAVSASQLLPGNRQQTDLEREQKKRLHAMEVGEAAALLKSGKKETDDEDDDDESQERGQNGVKS
ncbi:hypothetical protein QBC46DRAFT_261210 [Diplogelasinospora grovesii]|uniref:UspA domain-containing protein n=1 Tax=Diplogelasinospora grovesii TaxID=303347 RepID=A0AAN6S591_9PEZI|nr:hypothetical protein QBC46DRAFT_261210 [Diplogelasinospora grovesii]